MSLIAGFVTVTFFWKVDSYTAIAGVGPFNFTYVPTNMSLLYEWDIFSGYSFLLAIDYGNQDFAPYQSFELNKNPVTILNSNQNSSSVLYGPILSGNDPMPLNISALQQFPSADTATLRGVSCLQTELWDPEPGDENLTCGIWASENVPGFYDTGVQLCLGVSTSNDANPYLFAGPKTHFCTL